MSIAPTTSIASTPPPDPPRQDDSEKWEQLFAAAKAGDIPTVIVLCTQMQLGWYSEDIERLTNQSKYYSPRESGADGLINILQSHTGGTVEIHDDMKAFLVSAKPAMEKHGEAMSADQESAYNKLMNGQDLNETESKRMYSWCLQAKEYVVPSEFRSTVVTENLKELRQKYDSRVQSGTTALSQTSTR